MEQTSCRVCGQRFWLVSHKHLRKHGLTVEDYERLFPGTLRVQPGMSASRTGLGLPRCARPSCDRKAESTTQRYCSSECATEHARWETEVGATIACLECGKRFRHLTITHMRAAHGLTMVEYRVRHPGTTLSSEEQRKVVRETRVHPDLPMCARPGCEQHIRVSWRRYCSRACWGRCRRTIGPLFGRTENGEVTAEDRFQRAQKRRTRERDDFRCRRCGQSIRGENSHVHHLIPRSAFTSGDLRAHDLDNLLTLCSTCHRAVENGIVGVFVRRDVERGVSLTDITDFLRAAALVPFPPSQVLTTLAVEASPSPKSCLPAPPVIDSLVPKEATA